MIGRIWMVAARDLKATLSNKAFLFGLLMVPAIVLLAITFVPRLLSAVSSPPVKGEIAVIDRSAHVLPELTVALDPQGIAERRDSFLAQTSLNGTPPPTLAWVPPLLKVHEFAGDAGLDAGKSWLLEQAPAGAPHLGLVVIPADAVTPDGPSEGTDHQPGQPRYGSYQLYGTKGLSEDTALAIHGALREALVSTRMKIQGLDRASIERTQEVTRPAVVVVGPAGEQVAQPVLRRSLPFIFGVLLFIAVMAGGQGLMMSMVEEKSNRVVEVLLAAVSPLELMCGKLLAQLAVGLLMLSVYVGLGLLALGGAAAAGLIPPALVAELFVFFLLAYLTYGAMMLTVGAAVSSTTDAQSLMAPVMMSLLIPYFLTALAMITPGSPIIVLFSFVPPVNSFLMLARLASDAPPPFWQVPVTVALGLGFAVGVLWFAAKVFRIGLLMHGKPPSFATLVRWARMA